MNIIPEKELDLYQEEKLQFYETVLSARLFPYLKPEKEWEKERTQKLTNKTYKLYKYIISEDIKKTFEFFYIVNYNKIQKETKLSERAIFLGIDELKEKNYIKIYRTGCFLFNNYVQIWFLIEYIGEDRLNQYIKIIEQSCNCKIIEQLSFY